MHDYVSTIRVVVLADLEDGKPVDIDACSRRLAPLCPGLTRRELQDVILEIVIAYGGGAVWGSDGKVSPSGSGEGGPSLA